MDTIRIARLQPGAHLPTRKHPDDAGLDFYALEVTLVPPHSAAILRTGIEIEIPSGYVGLLKPKGRNDHLVGAGVIDAGYQGEVLVKVVNPSDAPQVFQPGDAIAQMLLLPVATPGIEEISADELHAQPTQRGANGGILSQTELGKL